MQNIMEQLRDWPWLATLPDDIAGFRLVRELMQCGSQYRVFTYGNIERQRSFSVLYDQGTKEFLARVVVGLTQFNDINFIIPDINRLEKVLANRMASTIQRLSVFDTSSVCSVYRDKNILDWDFARLLPPQVAGFSLYITPSEPVKVLNGSYIIIDYSDFAAESNLMIYYNIYRDEFFGEMNIRRTPHMAGGFDARTIKDLEANLTARLEDTLMGLRMRLSPGGSSEPGGEK